MDDKAYTTEEKIEKYLNVSITEGDADAFILATQKYIDQLTGRNFKAETSASERLYNGNSRQALIIDDCVEVTKVEVGGNYWGDSFTEKVNTGSTPEYYLLPANYSADGVPVRKIGLRSSIFIDGHANHRITAKWGYSVAVPDDVSFAATVIAAGMYYENRGAKAGKVKSEKIGKYSVSYGSDQKMNDLNKAKSILDLYIKYEL